MDDFPIMGTPLMKSIPWRVMAPHARQAMNNHYQTLERLAQRGGLSPCEALAVLEDRPYQTMEYPFSVMRLKKIVDERLAAIWG